MKLTKRSDKVSKQENPLGISRRSFIRNTSLAAAGGVAGVAGRAAAGSGGGRVLDRAGGTRRRVGDRGLLRAGRELR